ncbi:Hint domain-containing protein [Ancylobacter oerskovii]|uniref:Hint domain-containing protein n=1 Tax=Ancylobacter oerskovii TaxID=459519 RepID=A0ABW4YTG1_9HYPH|nr:Hint domain-containing protein [Ancylobacter oerskovii]MBS7543782.1 Hint domain-containing protein [Ancylobacter oerskovii]
MAVETFAYTYLLNNQEKVQNGGAAGHAGNPYQNTTVDSGADNTVTSGENITIGGFSSGTATFLYASGDGMVVLYNGSRYLLTDTAQTGNSKPVNSGDSFVVCFLAGTMIATPTGEVAIETLKAGDLVLTAEGVARPVRWLARQTVSTVFADPLRVMPVRIRAGALGDNLPVRDLFVSADHALQIDGVLVQAGALVNDAGILRHIAMPKTFTYYHVELEDQSLILAEGVPAETFVDNVARQAFDNWEDAPEAPIAELDLPRVKSARQLPPHTRARLAELGARFARAA